MRKEDRVEHAVCKMASLGLPEKFVRAVTLKALKTYGGRWEFLEEADYSLLADLCFGELEADSLAVQNGQSMVILTAVQHSPGKLKAPTFEAPGMCSASAAADGPEFMAKVDDNYTSKLRKVKMEPECETSKCKGKAPADDGEVPMDEEDMTRCRKLKSMLAEDETFEHSMPLDTAGSSASRLRCHYGPGLRKFRTPFPFPEDDTEEVPVLEPNEPLPVAEAPVPPAKEKVAAHALALIANLYSDDDE